MTKNTLPPPNPSRKHDVPSLLGALDAEADILDRAYRGYTRFAAVHRQMTEGMAEGEKKIGVPPLDYSVGASRKDKNVMLRDQIDLGSMHPQYAAPIIAGICTTRAFEMSVAIDNLEKIVSHIKAQLAPVLSAIKAPEPQAQPEARQADLDDEEEEEEEEEEEFDAEYEDDSEEEEPEEVPPPKPARRMRKHQG